MSKLKVFESFSGIGTQSMALKQLGVDYETVGIAEIDKFAIQSYMAIHGETKNYGDISKIDPTELPDMDLFTYSFPCQDLSISGKQRGMGEGTRSGLLYECEKVITTKKPKYLLLENVKNLVGKKFKPDFDKWLEWLESQGYKNYWQVLNAKDYGVPQNRERVFVVSILGEETYEFPSLQKDIKIIKHDIPQEVTVRKYDVDIEGLQRVLHEGKKLTGYTIKDIADIIGEKKTTVEHWFRKDNCFSIPDPDKWVTLKMILLIDTDEFDESIMTFETRLGTYEKANRVYDVQGIAPTLTTGKGELILDYNFPETFPLEVKLKDILEDEVDEKYYLSPEMQSRFTYNPQGDNILGSTKGEDCTRQGNRDRVYSTEGTMACLTSTDYKQPKQIMVAGRLNQFSYRSTDEVLDTSGICTCINTMQGGHRHPKIITEVDPKYRIRRLTPLECWRLMGITDEDFYKAKNSGISDSQLYKQAGNAIVVDVLVGIFGNLFDQEYYLSNTTEDDFVFNPVVYPFVYENEAEQLRGLN
ncbi:DNA (cytosine-5-)-methyltransferase [Bacillus mycoides]|uniref:DNA (cytosine-5-)-methyltransferase n=1 Tax=Bacillus mycoides TaxID=1405 RepID=UPI00027C1786|nr:DNA (cytosine-5-)-methyltransferase [Bacillus mycoides]EJV59319.1 DNA (cytosine-5-)-methyltransferase [Bacillus mycoides]